MSPSRRTLRDMRGFVFDLDGCVWTGDVLTPGAAQVLALIRQQGKALCFLTNADHVPVLNEEWTKRFKPPYSNRGILIVNAIGVPGIVILIQVHAYIEP